jgi:hypothetical protein
MENEINDNKELTRFGKILVDFLGKNLKIEAEDRGSHAVVKLKLRGKTISSCQITHGGAACY